MRLGAPLRDLREEIARCRLVVGEDPPPVRALPARLPRHPQHPSMRWPSWTTSTHALSTRSTSPSSGPPSSSGSRFGTPCTKARLRVPRLRIAEDVEVHARLKEHDLPAACARTRAIRLVRDSRHRLSQRSSDNLFGHGPALCPSARFEPTLRASRLFRAERDRLPSSRRHRRSEPHRRAPRTPPSSPILMSR